MGTRSSEQRRGSPPETGYLLEGSVLEAPPEARYRATGADNSELSMAAWQIGRGHINGVDVSRQIVLIVWTGEARLILVDERTTPEQVLALLDAFGGKLGAPWPSGPCWRQRTSASPRSPSSTAWTEAGG